MATKKFEIFLWPIRNKNGSNPHAVSTGAGSNCSRDTGRAAWFIASRASNHMTGDPGLISDLVPVSNQVVKAGNGEGMQMCGKGCVNTEMVVLPDVWYVPGLEWNLVSVGQLTTGDPDLIVEIGGGACRIGKVSDGSTMGRAHLRSDNKYELCLLSVNLSAITVVVHSSLQPQAGTQFTGRKSSDHLKCNISETFPAQ
ncbi:hypothetical protein EJB05_25853, partial [Eragrostis curvula]